jgi:hypothetical protein
MTTVDEQELGNSMGKFPTPYNDIHYNRVSCMGDWT